MHSSRSLLSCCAVLFTLCALASCGGGGSPGVVQVGHESITQANVDHWAKAFAGEAFVVDLGIPASHAVLANLANDSRCATAVAPVAAKARSVSIAARRKPPLTAAQLRTRCRELYASAKRQATEYLISVQAALAEADKYKIKVTSADARQYLARWKQSVLADPTELGKYLTERGWTLADELFDAKRAVLWLKLTQHIRGLANAAGGGEKVYADLLRSNAQQVTNLTHCNAAYAVPGCRGYHPPAHAALSLAVAAEHFVSH